MIKIKQTIVVEGKYDKSKLSSFIDATIITTEGFDIFRDKEKLALLRRLARQDGIIVLTDSDRAGCLIRSHIAGAIPPQQITHVYIPDVFGKEHRKEKPSAEGKLGVEGLSSQVLLEAFQKAGIAVVNSLEREKAGRPVTKGDLMELGLAGGENSHLLRLNLQKKLGLPGRLNTNGLLRVLNQLYTYEEFLSVAQQMSVEKN